MLQVLDALAPEQENLSLSGSFSLDAWNRLAEARLGLEESSQQTFGYTYDRIDNITNKTSSAANVEPGQFGEYQYSASQPNALTMAGTLQMTYDATGAMTQRGDSSLEWDGFGRLQSVHNASGELSQFVYDGTGARVSQISEQGVTHYISDDFEVRDGVGVIYARLGMQRLAKLEARRR